MTPPPSQAPTADSAQHSPDASSSWMTQWTMLRPLQQCRGSAHHAVGRGQPAFRQRHDRVAVHPLRGGPGSRRGPRRWRRARSHRRRPRRGGRRHRRPRHRLRAEGDPLQRHDHGDHEDTRDAVDHAGDAGRGPGPLCGGPVHHPRARLLGAPHRRAGGSRRGPAQETGPSFVLDQQLDPRRLRPAHRSRRTPVARVLRGAGGEGLAGDTRHPHTPSLPQGCRRSALSRSQGRRSLSARQGGRSRVRRRHARHGDR